MKFGEIQTISFFNTSNFVIMVAYGRSNCGVWSISVHYDRMCNPCFSISDQDLLVMDTFGIVSSSPLPTAYKCAAWMRILWLNMPINYKICPISVIMANAGSGTGTEIRMAMVN